MNEKERNSIIHNWQTFSEESETHEPTTTLIFKNSKDRKLC